MVRVFVHAGLPKTGTTTIQRWLSENAAALKANGIFTFQNRRLGHRLAAEAIISAKRRSLPDIRPVLEWRVEDSLNALRDAVEDPAVSRAVISSEYFSEADPALVKKLFTDLSLDDVTIILVFRRQDRLIESGYNQSVRAVGWTERVHAPHYHPRYDWHVMASSWASAFGRDNISLHLYEEIRDTGAPLMFEIFKDLDPGLAAFALDRGDDKVVNPSLPAALLELKRLANAAGTPEVLPYLEAASQQNLGGPPFRLDPAVARGWLECYRDSNRKLASEFLGRDGDLFDATDLESDTSGADYTGKLPGEIVATILMLYMQDQKRKSDSLAETLAEAREASEEQARVLQSLHEKAQAETERLREQFEAAAERLRKAEADVARLQDITSPRRLMEIAWTRLTAPFKRKPQL